MIFLVYGVFMIVVFVWYLWVIVDVLCNGFIKIEFEVVFEV